MQRDVSVNSRCFSSISYLECSFFEVNSRADASQYASNEVMSFCVAATRPNLDGAPPQRNLCVVST